MRNDSGDLLPRSSPSMGRGESIDVLSPQFASLDYRNPEFTWEQAVRVLRKNRRFGLLLSGFLIALTLAVAVLMKDVYQPVARIEIAPPTSGIRTLQEIESTPGADDQDYLETQTQILQSDGLAISVIRQLHLDKNREPLNPKSITAARNEVQPATESTAQDKAFFREQLSLATLTPSESLALDEFRRNLEINPIRNTRLVEVSFASRDPELAQQVTNKVITTFIENDYKQRYSTTTQASEWLSSQLSGLYRKVVESNEAVADYQRKYGLVEMDDHDVPLSQLMGEINHQLSEAQASRIESEAYLQMIDAGQSEYVPPLRDDKVYQDLRLREGDLQTQLAQARAVYGDANTNIKKLQDQLSAVSQQITDEQKRITESIRTAFSAAKERESLMLGSREKVRREMVDANSEIVGYRALKNEAMANADLYNTLQARLKEAGIYAGLGSSNIRVVDLAPNLQQPTGPHRAALVGIGTLIASVIGVFGCFVKESLNNTVRTPEDVRAWAGLKSLALLPAMHPEQRKLDNTRGGLRLPRSSTLESSDIRAQSIIFIRPSTAEAEAMRDLRTSLAFSGRKGSFSTILISSAMQGEGKTTVAVNFAIATSHIGRTCLVDADLRQPMAAQAFGIERKPGLSDVLNGSASLNSALVAVADVPGLWVLPSGSPVENPADVLSSGQMQELCASLRQQFSFIAIDSSPVIRFSDARHLSRLADDVVLVGRYGITTRRAIQRSAELLQDVQAPLAGLVLNDIDYASPDYHYFMYGYSKLAGKQAKRSSGHAHTPRENAEESPAKSKGAHA